MGVKPRAVASNGKPAGTNLESTSGDLGALKPDSNGSGFILGGITDASAGTENRGAAAARGRKAKTEKPQGEAETLTVQTEEIASKPKRTRSRKSVAKKDGTAAAQAMIGMVEIFAVGKFGMEAAFNDQEKMLIEAPLARLIEKYGSIADEFSGLLDPAMFIAGLALYGVRLGRIAREAAAEQSTPPQPPAETPTNGATHEAAGSPVPSADPSIWAQLGTTL